MRLLRNAIYSIEAGIEDYKDESEKRNISAVRNVFAGILLLFKEKLVRLSPERDKNLLIKKDIVPVKNENGEIVFEGSGTKTVDVHDIKESFKSLGVKVDWKRFDEINKLRNELEHFYTDKSSDKVQEILAKSFLIIQDFLTNELNEEPSKIIDREWWSKLLELEEIYSAEERVCKESFKSFNWKYKTITAAIKHIRCDYCESALIKLVEHKPYEDTPLEKLLFSEYNTKMSCASCGELFYDFPHTFEKCIEAHLGADAYIAGTQGGMPPYQECPECNMNGFIFDEGCCVLCGYQPEYDKCARCNAGISLDEQDLEGLCSYCSNLLAKVMSE